MRRRNGYFHRIMSDAIANGNESIVFFEPTKWSDSIRASARYYGELLGARKVFGHIASANFEKREGRKPNPEELTRILQKTVRDRGLTLATKGLEKPLGPTFLADEQTIIYAIFHSILTGQETFIFGGDPDLHEQFYKCLCLIDNHYRAMLIGDLIHAFPYDPFYKNFPTEGFFTEFFGPPDVVFVPVQKDDVPRLVLPKNPTYAMVTCQRFVQCGDTWHGAARSFCAEREMARLLEHKGESGGLNSLHFNGRNCHLLTSPPFPPEARGLTLLASDLKFEVLSLPLPIVDLNYAFFQIERFEHIVLTGETPDAAWA
jgi:hypothetical protein